MGSPTEHHASLCTPDHDCQLVTWTSAAGMSVVGVLVGLFNHFYGNHFAHTLWLCVGIALLTSVCAYTRRCSPCWVDLVYAKITTLGNRVGQCVVLSLSMMLVLFHLNYNDDGLTHSRRNRDLGVLFAVFMINDAMAAHTGICLLCVPRCVAEKSAACYNWFWELEHICVRWDNVSTTVLFIVLAGLLLSGAVGLGQSTTAICLAAMISLQSISLFWFSGCSRCVAEATVIGCTHLRQVWTAFYNGLEHSCDVWYLGSYFLSGGIEVLVPLHNVHYGRSAFITYLSLAFSVAFLLHVLAKAFTKGCPGCWRTHGFKVEGFMARMNRD
ncbi:hypothetical protein LTR95_011284 [Oleoguttula sp. CCFEE 5521]